MADVRTAIAIRCATRPSCKVAPRNGAGACISRWVTTIANLPAGTRAVALPDNSYNKSSAFLRVFGRPEATSVCECERVQTGSLAQSLHMINASEIKVKVAVGGGTAQRLAQSKAPLEERIEELYWIAYGRAPRKRELEVAKEYVLEERSDVNGNPIPEATLLRDNFQDLVWALMNTKEFLFNH